MQLPVSHAKQQALTDWMERLGITEADLVESFVRSSGAGGQHVNKVSSCVVLRHGASGIEVKCQDNRSQAMNRYHARKRLCEQVEAIQLGKESKQQQKIAKIRRQKRKRSKRAKDKMLDDKTHHGQKKSRRKVVTDE